MQQPQHKLTPRAPPPQGFGGGVAFSPIQGIGIGASSSSSSQAAAAAVAAAASARAAEQMAYEDAWKASHPDFRTPFASVEDAVTRLLPYHVFADYEGDDADGGTEEMSSDERWDNGVMATLFEQIAEFEKQVVTFNVVARKHGEERLMLERALLQDEHRATERLRATLVVQHEQQQQRQKQQEEAARASRLALAQAQAQVASAWPLVQPTASAWQHALAAAAAGRGEEVVPGQVAPAPAQGAAMHPQLDPATASAWLMMHQQHQQQQQQLQLSLGAQQQQQPQLSLGAWPAYAAPLGGDNSMGQAGPSTVWQEQAGEQTMGGAAAGGMAQPWWASGAQRREP
ncbi:hypothetical protein ACQ4PT_043114 [Festuca glaucescens]